MNKTLGITLAAVLAAGATQAPAQEKKQLAFIVNAASDFWKLSEAGVAKAQAEPMAMVAAWRAIGQMAGLYGPEKTPRTAPGTWGVRMELERMSDAQLRAVIAAGG